MCVLLAAATLLGVGVLAYPSLQPTEQPHAPGQPDQGERLRQVRSRLDRPVTSPAEVKAWLATAHAMREMAHQQGQAIGKDHFYFINR